MEFEDKLEMLEKRVDRLERFAGVCMGQIIDLMETVFILVETMPDYDSFSDEYLQDESASAREHPGDESLSAEQEMEEETDIELPEEAEREEILSKEREEELEFGYGEGFSDVEYAAEYLMGEYEEESDGRFPGGEKEAPGADDNRTDNGNREADGDPAEEEESEEQEAKRQPAVPVNPIL